MYIKIFLFSCVVCVLNLNLGNVYLKELRFFASLFILQNVLIFDVNAEGTVTSKVLSTMWALIWLHFGVRTHMLVKYIFSLERSLALGTGERLFFRVGAHVSGKGSTLTKAIIAILAGIRFLLSMGTDMVGEVASLVESFFAIRAAIRSLLSVHSSVKDK